MDARQGVGKGEFTVEENHESRLRRDEARNRGFLGSAERVHLFERSATHPYLCVEQFSYLFKKIHVDMDTILP